MDLKQKQIIGSKIKYNYMRNVYHMLHLF